MCYSIGYAPKIKPRCKLLQRGLMPPKFICIQERDIKMTKNSNYTKKKIEKVIKRNGEVVDFNQINIQRSILNCVVNNTETDSIKAGEIAEKITKRVINIISIKKNKPSVEYIQDKVGS